MSEDDEKLWDFMMAHPSFIALIDGGFGVISPLSPIRQKIFVMLAVLEADPYYSSKFLSPKQSIVNFYHVAAATVKAMLKAVIGVIFIKGFKWIRK